VIAWLRSILLRPAPTSGRVLPQLDALRGVAILAVFVQHLGDRFMPFVASEATRTLPASLTPWLLTALYHAHWGVDLFFVLSGFSLAQGYLRAFERGTPTVGARRFLLRRAARILPGYYVALAVMIAVRHAVLRQPGVAASLLTHLLVLQGYVTPGGIVLIGATWSLTTEIGFYLLLPVLARPLLGGRHRAILGATLCVLAWSSRAALHDLVLQPGVRTALLEATQRRWFTSRLDDFVLGALAAAAHARGRHARLEARARRLAPVAVAVAIVALVVGFRLEGELYLQPRGAWPYAVVSLATAALVLAAVHCEGWAERVVAPRWLQAVGVVSYGVFLYHQLAIGLSGAALPGAGWACLGANGVAALSLSLLAGSASWVAIERPAMRWGAGASAGSAHGVLPSTSPRTQVSPSAGHSGTTLASRSSSGLPG
jgi:peptidoglycan/LPS O-acetylase OafA/YrhL